MITTFFTACGGGGTTTANTQTDTTTLKLTVGNSTLDSKSSLLRVTSIINAEKNVSQVSINKEGTISLSGGDDSHLFELLDIMEGKQLAFKTTPDAPNPTDTNSDGIYEVDIMASDNDGQSVTYQAAYKIAVPVMLSSLLSGKTYYVDLGNDEYNEISFNDDTISYKGYKDTLFVPGSQATVSITYTESTFEFIDEGGTNTVCTIKDSSIPIFTCTENGGDALEVTFLSTAPEFIIPRSYTLATLNSNINNHHNSLTPQISSFSVTGNAPSENSKVVISKSKLNGKFKYNLVIGNALYAKLLLSGLTDGDKSIITTDSSFLINNTINYDCKFNNDNGSNLGIDYTCNNVNMNNTQGNADTELIIYVCDKEDTTSSELQCSSASIPVLFTE
jgi:hypothetical protein